MQSYHCVVLVALSSIVASFPASADTDLTGKWVGQFSGVQIEIPLEAGPFGAERGAPSSLPGPRFVENTLHIEFETQKNGLAVGIWNAGEFKKRFVCAQITQSVWNCEDSGGRASVEVVSAAEIKVCYLDNRQGAQGAGCAHLKKGP